jgi:hypothetical protein
VLVAACGSGGTTGASSTDPADLELARAALLEPDDLPDGFARTDAGSTVDPFSEVADGCDDLAALDDAATTARATGDAFLSGDRSRWVTSTVWVFADDAAAAAAMDAVDARDERDAAACFLPFFRRRFIEITVDVTPAPDLVLSDSTARRTAAGDAGVRVVATGRYEIGSAASPIVFELTIVRSGRALAMLQTMDGSTEPSAENAQLVETMLRALGPDT